MKKTLLLLSLVFMLPHESHAHWRQSFNHFIQTARQYSSKFWSFFNRNKTLKIGTGIAAVGALGLGLRYYFDTLDQKRKIIERELKRNGLLSNNSEASFRFDNTDQDFSNQRPTQQYHLYEIVKINNIIQLIINIKTQNEKTPFFETIETKTLKKNTWNLELKDNNVYIIPTTSLFDNPLETIAKTDKNIKFHFLQPKNNPADKNMYIRITN